MSSGSEAPANYPLTLVDSSEHRAAMRDQWERLFDDYAIPPDRRRVPDLTPVLHTPQSILGIGPIRLGASATGPLDDAGIRQLLRKFTSDYAQLLGVNPSSLSLESVASIGIGRRYSFVQAGYEYPVVPPAGRLEFVVSETGDLIQMSVSTIPMADIPAPRLSRAGASERVLGSTFTYGDIAGRPQSVTVTDPNHIVVKQLVIYPDETESTVAIRLCWEVEAGDGLTWTVFVDAVTGQTVGTRQNFQT